MVSWVVIVAVIALALIALVAWGMWLRFNYAIARAYGVDALKATPPVAEAFRPTDWMSPMAQRTAGRSPNGNGHDAAGSARGH
jgi:uncharacterized protein YneF (UPF0154 family)